MKKFPKILVFLILAVFLLAPSLYGMPILLGDFDGTKWEASDGEGRSATAVFSIDSINSSLMIVLTNIALETSNPNQVLAGLFFDFPYTLLEPSVIVNLGLSSSLVTDSGGAFASVSYSYPDLNGEFGYRRGISGDNGDRGDYGISATSLDPLGFSEAINSAHITIPTAPGGADFGLVGLSPGSNSSLEHDIYVQSSVVINWGIEGPPPNNAVSISNVHFIYGTDYHPIHEPATMLLLGSGLIGLGVLGRKKLFKKS